MRKIKKVIPMGWGDKIVYDDDSIGYRGKDSGAGSDPEPISDDVSTPGEIRTMTQESNPMMKKYIQAIKKKKDEE